QHAVAAEDQLLVGQFFDGFEGKAFRPMRAPRRLQRGRCRHAVAQRERYPVPDRGKVGRTADPLLPRGRAAHDIDAGSGFAFFIGRDSRLLVFAFHRSAFLITNLSPDHLSSTAQTFTSTRSVLSARARIKSSVTSVGILAAFLYHDTQIAPSVVMALRALGSCLSSSASDVTNRCTMSA